MFFNGGIFKLRGCSKPGPSSAENKGNFTPWRVFMYVYIVNLTICVQPGLI